MSSRKRLDSPWNMLRGVNTRERESSGGSDKLFHIPPYYKMTWCALDGFKTEKQRPRINKTLPKPEVQMPQLVQQIFGSIKQNGESASVTLHGIEMKQTGNMYQARLQRVRQSPHKKYLFYVADNIRFHFNPHLRFFSLVRSRFSHYTQQNRRKMGKEMWHYFSGLMAASCGTAGGVIKF